MRKIGIALTAALLPLLAGTGCATYGPTWSEISGTRYNVTIMNRRPTAVQTVDGNSAYPSYPIKLDPGAHAIRLAAPAPGWPGGSVVHTMDLTLQPCMRYYLNAQFENPTSPDWRPVVDYVEPIAGCKTLTAAK
jgi:hypothetical protein